MVIAGFVAGAVQAPAVGAETAATPSKPPVNMIDTGGGPSTPAVNPITNKIYVANAISDTLSVIDGESHRVTEVPTSVQPRMTLVNQRTNTVFVLTKAGLDVIDGATNKITRSVPKVTGRLAAINVETNKVYVVPITSRSPRVYEYDPARDDLVTVALSAPPNAIAVNEGNNKIYLSNPTNNTVTVINGGSKATTSVKAGAYPFALAVNPVTDKVYVANLGKRSDRPPDGTMLTVIDGDTNATSRIFVDVAPAVLAVDSTRNRIYVLSEITMALTVVDGNRGKVVGWVTTVGVGGLDVDERANRIYVGASPFVTVVDGNSLKKVRVDAGGRMPSAAVVNPVTGKAYVNNPASGNVAVLG